MPFLAHTSPPAPPAGALIAFIFPALVALKACDNQEGWGSHTSTLYWRANAWALIVLGIIQAVTGLAAVFLKPADGDNSAGGGGGGPNGPPGLGWFLF
jgi:hypothetical protein